MTYPLHIGLGSKTALLLALVSLFEEARNAGFSTEEKILLIGRGGASGIGVNLVRQGGVIVDSGHKLAGEQALCITPSSHRRPLDKPPVPIRLLDPVFRDLFIFTPKDEQHTAPSGESEREFFEKNTPVSASEVYETLAVVYHGIVPALISGSFSQLASGFHRLNSVGFKKREIAIQRSNTKQFLGILWQRSYLASGLSSVGPSVFSFIRDIQPGNIKEIESICDDMGYTVNRNSVSSQASCEIKGEINAP